MLSTALIIFRETLEIAMILGIVLAATRGLAKRTMWIAAGFIAGALGAGMVACFAQSISASLDGIGQEIFNALILFTAALFIGWTVVWMRRHVREMSVHLKKIGHDVTAGKIPLYSLSVIIGLAMLREGSEIVLFIYGMSLSGQSTTSIIEGSATGLILGVCAGTLVYFGLLKIPARYALQVTSWLLILLVAGLTSQGVSFLSAAGYFSTLSNVLWDSSWLLSDDSITGKALHSLIGYSAHPTAIQIIAYIATLATLLSIMGMIDKRHIRRNAIAVACIALGCFSLPSPAHAIDHFYSPIVNKGELEMEYVGNRTFDKHSEKNNIQGHETELEYGMTDRWLAIVSGAFTKDAGKSLKMEDGQVESVLQFAEQGEYWVDSGVLASYGFSTLSHTPDKLEVKLLLQKDTGRFTHLANIGFEQTVGHYSDGTGGPDYSFLWSSKYRYNEYLQPGFEIQNDMGHGPTLGAFNKQEDYAGPALYGQLIHNLKYEAAYLFGTSKEAAQGAARFKLEYEIYF